jgi:hypothetical protein
LEVKYIPVVIGCVANLHHVAWGSTDTNLRGAALLEYIANSNLEIVNRGSEPTFVRQQVIDITLSSASIWQEIVNWRVSKEVFLSGLECLRIPKYLTSTKIHCPLTGTVIKHNWFLGLVIGVVIF